MEFAALFQPQHGFPVKVINPRRCVRRVVHMPATAADDYGHFTSVVTNISEAGCALRLGTLFLLSHHLTLTLYPHGGTTSVQIALVKIRWVEEEWAGVEFVNSSQEDQAKLQRLCREPAAYYG